ncbi:hypothetical protein PVK06_040427 [Gossypium arboreum]|uniref:Uncharacterized protein n=1 Tax=Gossypium arboreum TaxID=29729 RepID=A0ABR0N5F2_GOSAR|nr:hypothetical protein PVK06_040427 [Gossypium arboreum]
MSRKRTRSSKTTLKNSILIDEEVKGRFNLLFKYQPMMPKKGFNLKTQDFMVVPIPIRKKINALKWERFCDTHSLPDDELVQKFYASLTMQDATEVIVQKKKVPLTSKSINDLFNLPDVEKDEYHPMVNNINWDFLQQVLDVVTNPGSQWIIRRYITNHDLERLVKKVHESNLREQEEPTESDIDESTNETKTEVNSVTETEEEESDKESNSPKPVEGFTTPKLEVEPEKETVKLSVEPESTSLMLTSASTARKSELSIMMDMYNFMHNQQQTYWKYAKIRDNSI